MSDCVSCAEADLRRAEEVEEVSDDEDEVVGDGGEWDGLNSVEEESGIVKTAAMLQRLSQTRSSFSLNRHSKSSSSRESSFLEPQSSQTHTHTADEPEESVIEVSHISYPMPSHAMPSHANNA